MYSVVLATMLTTGSAAPSFGFGWHGCCGGCYGCYGCYGCCGGCYGCYGCYGCCGGYYYSSCCGCWGGSVVYTYPVYTYPVYTYPVYTYPVYSSCYGCCGTVVVQPTAPPVVVPQEKIVPVPVPKVEQKKTTSIEIQEETPVSNVAKVIIAAPAGVRVSVNGTAVALKGAEQAFETPELEPGANYSYMVTAEAVRDGKTLSTTRKVSLVAGQEVRVDFRDFAAVPAGASPVASR